MKPIVKQKLSTLQDIINNAQSGGGTVDAYTKAEADAKFETKTDAASTYLSKSDAANMVNKKSVVGIVDNNILQFKFSDVDLNSLDNSIVIFKLLTTGLPPIMPLMHFLFADDNTIVMYRDGYPADDMIISLLNQTLTVSIPLQYDFSNVSAGTATIIY